MLIDLLMGGQGGGSSAQILYVGVGFPSRIQCIKNFEGGGLRGSWGWGLRSNFGAPFLYVYVLFWGLIHPLDRYRTPSAIGSAIGRPISRPTSHPNTGGSPQPPRYASF